jgi:zinc protease
MKNKLFFYLSLLLGATALAQEPATRVPAAPTPSSVRQILDNYEKAIGGTETWTRIKSRVIKGTMEIPETRASGTFETYEAQQPGRICLRMKFGNGAAAEAGYDGQVGWARSPETGLRRLTGEQLVDVKRGAQVPEEINFRSFFTQMVLKGRVKVAGREAYVIVGSSPEGSPWSLYFDARTWMRVRLDWTHTTAQGSESMQVYYDDYREPEGFKMKCPFHIKQKAPNYTIIQHVDTIQFNVPVDDAVLKAPSFKATIRRWPVLGNRGFCLSPILSESA